MTGLYDVRWKHSARKELKKLPRETIPKIITTVEELSENPYPQGNKKIIGSEHTYRVRVGDYRIVYSVESGELVIEIIRVRHRKNVYKKPV